MTNLDHLTPEQKKCLGRDDQFIVERGRRNRAIVEKKQMAVGAVASRDDTNSANDREEYKKQSARLGTNVKENYGWPEKRDCQ